jgi:hypothetical protein
MTYFKCIESDLIARAGRALARRAERDGFLFNQPSSYSSEVVDDMVILRNCNGELARYRIVPRPNSDDVRLEWFEFEDEI